MAKLPPHFFVYGALAIGGLGALTASISQSMVYPWQLWFTDMMDAQTVKAYEAPMRSPAEGSVSKRFRPYGDAYGQSVTRMTPEGQALKSPYDSSDPELLKTGEWAYGVYCSPCHNTRAEGNGPVTQNKPNEGQRRFQMPAPALVGPKGSLTLNPMTTDGYVYLTIRNGGAIMPSYGMQLSEKEIWGIVAYLRKLDK